MNYSCSDVALAMSILLSRRQSTALACHRYNQTIEPNLLRNGIRCEGERGFALFCRCANFVAFIAPKKRQDCRFYSVIPRVHRGQREVLPGANGLLAAQVAVAGEVGRARDDVAAEPVHELSKGGELALCRMRRFEVPHETNADGGQIKLIAFYMTAEQLLSPAGADLDLSVARVDAVADDKMVGKAVLHAPLAVGAVVDGRVAVFDRTMVDDDALPVVGADINLGSLGAHALEKIFGRDGRGHLELLPYADQIARDAIRTFQISDGNTVRKRDPAEGVAAFDYINIAGNRRCGRCAFRARNR